MLRLLGQEEYGLYKLSSAATSYLSLVSVGMGGAIVRYLIKSRVEGGQVSEERMLGLFLMIFRVVAVLCLLLGLVLTFNLDIWYGETLGVEGMKTMRWLVFIMVCNMALSFSVSPYLAVVTAHERFIFSQVMGIITTVGIPLLNLVALVLGYASIGLAVTSFLVTVLSRFVYCWYVKRSIRIRPSYKELPLGTFKEILVFSFWIFVANVVSRLYVATDTMMIGGIPALAASGVAVYSIGITLDLMISSLSVGASNLLSPRINTMVFKGASSSELTDYSIRFGRVQSYISGLLVAAFVLFGKPFLHLYAGAGYEDAYLVTLFVAFPKIIVLAQSVCLNIIIAQNKHRFRSLTYLGVAICNVIGTWMVLEKWGIQGAAFMSGLSFIIGHGFIMNWFYWKKTEIDIFRFWKELSRVFVVPVVICIIGTFFIHFIDLYNIWNLLISSAIFAIAVVAFQWFFCFNEYEKDLVKGFLWKLKVIKTMP